MILSTLLCSRALANVLVQKSSEGTGALCTHIKSLYVTPELEDQREEGDCDLLARHSARDRAWEKTVGVVTEEGAWAQLLASTNTDVCPHAWSSVGI